MTLDEAVLRDVEAARDHLERLESSVFEARRAFHHAIRQLHAAGGSMREIAAALGMSHQRVHQIIGEDAIVEVEARVRDVVPLPTPGRDEAGGQVAGGPGAGAVGPSSGTAGPGGTRTGGVTPTPGDTAGAVAVPTARSRAGASPVPGRCAFCGAEAGDTTRLLGTAGRRFICGSCVAGARSRLAVRAARTCSYCGRASSSTATTPDGATSICEACVASCERLLGSKEAPRRTIGRANLRLRCSFCNATASEAAKLLGGPGAHICDECVAAAGAVVEKGAPSAGPRSVILQPASREAHACAFCRKVPAQVTAMVKGGRGRICDECLDRCAKILADDAGS